MSLKLVPKFLCQKGAQMYTDKVAVCTVIFPFRYPFDSLWLPPEKSFKVVFFNATEIIL